jgi:ABC-2 type transport system ATP-binding protein
MVPDGRPEGSPVRLSRPLTSGDRPPCVPTLGLPALGVLGGDLTERPESRPPPLEGSSGPLLRVEGLTKVYEGRSGAHRANDAIDLAVYPGEIVAVLGPNGAGKTTLLRQIAGQLLPSAGAISIAGVDMVRAPLRAKEHLSVIPQECEPRDNLTVGEHVRYFALLKGTPSPSVDAEVERLLRETGLSSEKGKLVRELSGGLRRRVLIAIALAGRQVRLLLLDEPTTGVDPEGRRSVWKLVDTLRSRSIAILLTTHYIEEAEYLADRVVIVHRGRIAASGTPDEIRARLPYRGRLEIRGLDHLSPAAKKVVDDLERRFRVGLRAGNAERLEIPDPFQPSIVAELARLTDEGVPAMLAPVSLEDAYLAVVGAEGTEA